MTARALAATQRSAGEHALPAFVGFAAPVLDIVAIMASGLLARKLYGALSDLPVDLNTSFGLSAMLAVIFVMLMRSRGLYEARHILSLERQLRSTATAWFLALGIILAFVFLLKASHDISRGSILVLTLCGLVALLGHRLLWRAGFARAVEAGLVRRRTAFVLSLVPLSSATRQVRALRLAGIDVAQRVEVPAEGPGRQEAIAAAMTRMRDEGADEVILVGGARELHLLDDVMGLLRSLAIPVRLLPDETLSRLARQPAKSVGGFALIDIKREPLGAAELATKRGLDIVVAGAALLVAAPLLCLAMAMIKLDSPGPVLFRQTRRGFNGRTFRILKLRTMTCLEDGEGITQASRLDPRVTRVGFWLRRTSIDELPQFWNVLRGEMSVVGPRPHAVAHDRFYDPIIENYAFRQHVKPGLTGWAQVNGHRGETPEVSMMAARVDHDVWYVNNWSLFLDIRILFLTGTRLLARSAY